MRPVALAAAGVAVLTAHTAVNARLLRTPTATTTAARVSVLLPLRDEAARVEPCLRALLAQTGVDLEIVVLDDGSTDGTLGVEEEFAICDPDSLDLVQRFEDMEEASERDGVPGAIAGELIASEVEFRTELPKTRIGKIDYRALVEEHMAKHPKAKART